MNNNTQPMNDKQLTPEETKPLCTCNAGWQYQQQTAALQARVVELEEENAKWPETVDGLVKTFSDRLTKMNTENEKLMGLLEKKVKDSSIREYSHLLRTQSVGEIINEAWQSYCTEHSLKPTDNGTR